jgi:hypothetical protein
MLTAACRELGTRVSTHIEHKRERASPPFPVAASQEINTQNNSSDYKAGIGPILLKMMTNISKLQMYLHYKYI